MSGLRIGLDGSCWSNRRGFGRFTRCLLRELVPLARDRGHEPVVVAARGDFADGELPDARHVTVEVSAAPSDAAAAGGSRSLRDMAAMARAATAVRSDVFFFPATYSYVPVLRTKLVVTPHDAIAESLPDLVVPTRADRWRWTAKQRLALWQAAAVLTVSQAAREEVVRVLGVERSRVHVVAEAAEGRFRPASQGDPATAVAALEQAGMADVPYLLYVGGFSPHKNLIRLVRAFDLVLAEHPDAVLVLAGDIDDDPFLSSAGDVRRAIAALRRPERAVVTGFVTDDELVDLYRGATATVLVSLGEGFGLPVAESLACGTPVVVSDIPALRELAGDAGLVVDPRREESIAAAMATMLTDRPSRDRMAGVGLERSSTRTWAAAAVTVLDLLEEVARR